MVFEEGDTSWPLPEWHAPPPNVIVENLLDLVVPTPMLDYITIYNHEKRQDFIVRAQPTTDNEQLCNMVANVVDATPMEIDLRDQRGERWMYPESMNGADVAALHVRRGGMQQGAAGDWTES